ncbi:probable LRR receptor-like serine/threonine-protein kinase RKF3 [Tripterygium wilfordii]|uniref:probable LRR receptor-like serine/threonine-protein kinase RKF3 n=1 Tax=Tripterygium wilfordii TaxID=458696 RepID=UPI0018F81008|nr:probable LRR receptor-like serine/threonine-protein kinase RKF3 [Tripterygium wilfordii]
MKKYDKLPSSSVFLFVSFTTLRFVCSQTLPNCILNIQWSSSSSMDSSKCGAGNWGGFNNYSCCGEAFDAYLYALAQRANQTRRIYLNSKQQQNCIASMKAMDKDIDICGIEKLTGGAGGCSSYTTTDVFTNLGDRLRDLGDDCGLLGSNGTCTACLKRWEEIGGGSSDNNEANLCRFAVLITLTSNRLEDEKWIHEVYNCLSMQNLTSAAVLNDTTGNETENASSGKSNRKSGKLLLIIGLVGIGVVVVIAFAAWVWFRRKKKLHFPTIRDTSYNSLSGETNILKISVKEIYTATGNLSASNYIGQGIAGKVYKGVLSSGQHVAVKHIINDGHIETFVREIASLSQVRHPNLVALLGYCEKEDECFLVYELCHNGDLSEWLYGKDRTLSWIKRLEIAIDSARGLWFLHTYPQGRIIHRDIKPTNILISADFQAKLSDFGLSKVMDVGQSYVSSEVRGTWGYVDPEYRMNRHVNALGDVYSFGIVLLQLLSGQKVINLNTSKPMTLNKMAKFLTRGGNITDFADPKLNGEYSKEAFDLVVKLALLCTGIKKDRPSMEQVVLRLEKALNISTQQNSYID